MKTITNIQKFSIHDGDGIRTTVFFKGCPLKCVWCHNPETQKFERQMQCDYNRCTGCGTCAKICPNGAITMVDGKPHHDPGKCNYCDKCTLYCPAGVREIVGKEYTVKELMKELKKDLMFYERSGGGVTLSGGEVMAQDMEFIMEIAKQLKKEEITLTIDTCGQAPYERYEKILPYVDTFLYDVKVMDPEIHKKYMGVDNTLILDNLVKLAEAGARIYIRIPTIKEVNGTDDNMQATIDFLKEHHITPACVNLLPYHDTGSSKYSKLDMIYEGTELHAPDSSEMEHFVTMFKDAGFQNTKIGG